MKNQRRHASPDHAGYIRNHLHLAAGSGTHLETLCNANRRCRCSAARPQPPPGGLPLRGTLRGTAAYEGGPWLARHTCQCARSPGRNESWAAYCTRGVRPPAPVGSAPVQVKGAGRFLLCPVIQFLSASQRSNRGETAAVADPGENHVCNLHVKTLGWPTWTTRARAVHAAKKQAAVHPNQNRFTRC